MSPLFILYNLIFRYCSGGPPSSHLCISAMPCSDLRSSASFFIVRPPEMHSSPIGPSQPIKFLHQFATRGGVVYYYTLGKNAAGPLIFFAAARTSDEVHDFTFIAQSISCMYLLVQCTLLESSLIIKIMYTWLGRCLAQFSCTYKLELKDLFEFGLRYLSCWEFEKIFYLLS